VTDGMSIRKFCGGFNSEVQRSPHLSRGKLSWFGACMTKQYDYCSLNNMTIDPLNNMAADLNSSSNQINISNLMNPMSKI
jgi:hypothetical protein